MSLERLLAKIIKDADNAGRALIEEARQEAERIRTESWYQAAQAGKAARDEIMERAESERVAIMGERLARSRATYLTRQEELYEEIFHEALRQAGSLPEEQYRAWLKGMIIKGSSSGDEETLASPHDRRLLEQGLLDEINQALRAQGDKGSLSLAPQEAPFSRGVVLKGGKIENNLSLEMALRQVRDENEEELLKIIFGESRIKGLQSAKNNRGKA